MQVFALPFDVKLQSIETEKVFDKKIKYNNFIRTIL